MKIKFIKVNKLLDIVIPDKLITVITGNNKDKIYRLLTKKEDCLSGQIYLEDKNLTEINDQQLDKILGPSKLNFKNKIASEVNQMLKDFNLNKKILKVKYENLSLSEKQKIKFINAVLTKSKILLLDNPSYGLNNQDKKTMIRHLQKINFYQKRNIIIISDDCEFNNKVAQYLICYHNEEIASGLKNEIYKSNRFIFDEMTEFINKLNQKKLHFIYRTEISDLAKDIYRRLS